MQHLKTRLELSKPEPTLRALLNQSTLRIKAQQETLSQLQTQIKVSEFKMSKEHQKDPKAALKTIEMLQSEV